MLFHDFPKFFNEYVLLLCQLKTMIYNIINLKKIIGGNLNTDRIFDGIKELSLSVLMILWLYFLKTH